MGKKGESEKEEDERSSQSVCRARLNLLTGKFRLRLEVMQKSGTDGDHSTFEVFLLPDPVGTHAGREEEGAGKKERERIRKSFPCRAASSPSFPALDRLAAAS